MRENPSSEIEQPAGPPDIEPIDPKVVDQYRKLTYTSYESYLTDRLRRLDSERPALWHHDYSSMEAYLASVETMRDRLKDMLGFWEAPALRPPIAPQNETVFLETDEAVFSRFSYEILPGLVTYALRIVPRLAGPRPGMLIQHGYGGTPELACGLAATSNGEDYAYRSFGLRAAALHGFHVIAPHHPVGYGTLSDKIDVPRSGDRQDTPTDWKNRLHRLCVLGGGTLIGLDLLASSRAVDLLAASPEVDAGRIGLYGLSRGGQTALLLPAMDQRIGASVSSAFFNDRLRKLIGPYSKLTYLDATEECQFFPNHVRYFADADMVSLIAPRAFAVEAGVSDSSVDQAAALEEYRRACVHYEKLGLQDRIEFIGHQEGHVPATARAFQFLAEQLEKT